MTFDEAAALIADPRIDRTTWADLGCGDGTFTRALATLLPPGGVIHAMDPMPSLSRGAADAGASSQS